MFQHYKKYIDGGKNHPTSATGIGLKIIDSLSSGYLAISLNINGVILVGFIIATILLLLPMHRSD